MSAPGEVIGKSRGASLPGVPDGCACIRLRVLRSRRGGGLHKPGATSFHKEGALPRFGASVGRAGHQQLKRRTPWIVRHGVSLLVLEVGFGQRAPGLAF